MASLEETEKALAALGDHLHALSPELRARHIPTRDVSITVRDLDVAFRGRLSPDGLDGTEQVDVADARKAQVRFVADSDHVVAIGEQPAAFVGLWVRGRVKVFAGWRDLFQLRSIL